MPEGDYLQKMGSGKKMGSGRRLRTSPSSSSRYDDDDSQNWKTIILQDGTRCRISEMLYPDIYSLKYDMYSGQVSGKLPKSLQELALLIRQLNNSQ